MRHERRPEANSGDSRTRSEFAVDQSIPAILKRHSALGINPMRPLTPERCQGLIEPMTYAEAFQVVRDANNSFMGLPASIRDRFKNNAAALFDFVNDSNNLTEAIQLGLIEAPKKEPEAPPPVQPLVVTGGSDTKPLSEGTK